MLAQVADPKVQKRLEDPTLVLVILGYADLQGNDQNNIELSRRRAQTVLDVLRDKSGVANLMYPIPMGGSDLFDKREFSKNRVVEVWAVRALRTQSQSSAVFIDMLSSDPRFASDGRHC